MDTNHHIAHAFIVILRGFTIQASAENLSISEVLETGYLRGKMASISSFSFCRVIPEMSVSIPVKEVDLYAYDGRSFRDDILLDGTGVLTVALVGDRYAWVIVANDPRTGKETTLHGILGRFGEPGMLRGENQYGSWRLELRGSLPLQPPVTSSYTGATYNSAGNVTFALDAAVKVRTALFGLTLPRGLSYRDDWQHFVSTVTPYLAVSPEARGRAIQQQKEEQQSLNMEQTLSEDIRGRERMQILLAKGRDENAVAYKDSMRSSAALFGRELPSDLGTEDVAYLLAQILVSLPQAQQLNVIDSLL